MLQDLLTAASSHFKAFGNSTAEAQSLLGLAELQLLSNQPQIALEQVQQAFKLSADVSTKLKAVSLLAKLQSSISPEGKEAVRTLQEGVSTMHQVAR